MKLVINRYVMRLTWNTGKIRTITMWSIQVKFTASNKKQNSSIKSQLCVTGYWWHTWIVKIHWFEDSRNERAQVTLYRNTHYKLLPTSTVGSHFTTVHFTMIHFYDPCQGGPSTPDLWSFTVTTRTSFLYLVHF